MARGKEKSVEKRSRTAEAGPGFIGRTVRGLVLLILQLIYWLVKPFLLFFWRLAQVTAVMLFLATAYFYQKLPPHTALFDDRPRGSVTLLDRNGEPFAWRGDQYGGDLEAGEVSPHLVNAIIAAEDKRFYSHIGIDPRGLARAMMVNIQAGRIVQGGSTITQQVAKNTFLEGLRGRGQAKEIERKLLEVPYALAMEMRYSKEEILSIYLNQAYLGAGANGFEAASQRYFGKSARELNAAEAAMLAGLLRFPSRCAPTRSLVCAQERAAVVLGLMLDQGFLSEAEYREAIDNPATLTPRARADRGAFFADWVMRAAPAYLTRQTTEDIVVRTTFDPRIQAAAEEALAHVFETRVKEDSIAEAAIVVMTPRGEVVAMIGGRQEVVGNLNRATGAYRQTGSAFKVVVYAAALEAGASPYDVMEDRPLTIRLPSGPWRPENYGGGYQGDVTLVTALAKSINTVAVRLSERTGREEVRALARAMGITTEIATGPAVALGVSEATLLDMTGVFAVIANGGIRITPYGAREFRLRGDSFPILEHGGAGERVLSENTARVLTWMMTRVVEDGTGRRARMKDRKVAGKTGTSQEARDAWFIGFTGEYVVGVWMGNDTPTPLRGVTGGGLPATIFNEVMTRISADEPVALAMTVPERPRAPAPSAPVTYEPTGDPVVDQIYRDLIETEATVNPDFRPFGAGDR